VVVCDVADTQRIIAKLNRCAILSSRVTTDMTVITDAIQVNF